jgi:hypothetical protein
MSNLSSNYIVFNTLKVPTNYFGVFGKHIMENKTSVDEKP